MCDAPFDGAQQLQRDVEAAQQLLGCQWYESVTAEELAAIKVAMVSGPQGLATHSGHWYKCANAHVVRFTVRQKRASDVMLTVLDQFAIGECGMPMELARCPESGARIGGRNHEMVSWMSRAEHME